MENSELGIIQELMEFLQDKMQYGEDDLSGRLGRKKPELEVTKIEGEIPMGDMPTDPDESSPMGDEMDEDPDSKLKRRLMQMRG